MSGSFISAYTIDTIVIEVIGEARSVTLSGRRIIELYDQAKVWPATLAHLQDAREENKRLREALQAITERHEWTPGLGRCVCDPHRIAREVLAGE